MLTPGSLGEEVLIVNQGIGLPGVLIKNQGV
jgi:hypothetical protein